MELPNQPGLHVRPAKSISDFVDSFHSTITIRTSDMEEENAVNAESIMGLLTLGASRGEELILEAEGKNGKEELEELSDFISSGCGVDYDHEK